MENSTKYKVAVKCCTYNQAQYITDALNGFVMQETDFPFVCCIIDDASTDGEQEVIRKYVAENFDLSEPDVAYEKETDDAYIMYARHKSNKNCFFAVLYLKKNLFHENEKKIGLISEWMDNTDYIALCEGDDYWTDPSKLQKQVDYLEHNKNISIATHNAIRVFSDGREEPFNCGVKTGVYNLSQSLYKGWFTPTASFLFRNDFVVSPLWMKNGSNGDMAYLFSNLLKGNLFYSDEIMSVYNYGTPFSMSSSTPKGILYQKKLGMLKTINQLSDNKYIVSTFPLMIAFYIKKIIYYIMNFMRNK